MTAAPKFRDRFLGPQTRTGVGSVPLPVDELEKEADDWHRILAATVAAAHRARAVTMPPYTGWQVARVNPVRTRRIPGRMRISTPLTFVAFWLLVATAGAQSLHDAAARGDVADIEILLAAGADPNSQKPDGQTPLHYAVLAGADAVADRLLAAGADPEAQDVGGTTPLHVAAAVGEVTAVEALLAAGANPDAQNRKGQTPLHSAAFVGTLQAMIDARASMRTRHAAGADSGEPVVGGSPPLRYPAFAGRDTIEALVSAGASPDARDGGGQTPLHCSPRRLRSCPPR